MTDTQNSIPSNRAGSITKLEMFLINKFENNEFGKYILSRLAKDSIMTNVIKLLDLCIPFMSCAPK
jgi:hypothetical protein